MWAIAKGVAERLNALILAIIIIFSWKIILFKDNSKHFDLSKVWPNLQVRIELSSHLDVAEKFYLTSYFIFQRREY